MQETALYHVLYIVSRHFTVSVESLIEDIRDPRVMRARLAAYWLARRTTEATFPSIGMVFDRDHATVHNGINRAEEMRLNDPRFAAKLDKIRLAIEDDFRQAEEAFVKVLAKSRIAVTYARMTAIERSSQTAEKRALEAA